MSVEPVAGFDRGRLEEAPRTPVSAAGAMCRYCKNVQPHGFVCERCGMRIPRVSAPAAKAGKRAAEISTRCSCGAPAKAGARCGECGRQVAVPEP